MCHIERLSPRIIKLEIAGDKISLRHLRKSIEKANILSPGQLYFCTDMEVGKTWLISENSSQN